MSRYIDAKVIKSLMKNDRLMQGNCEITLWQQEVDRQVDMMPSIDIVRCKECIHNGVIDTDCPFGWRDDYLPTPDDFCSYGERKDNE